MKFLILLLLVCLSCVAEEETLFGNWGGVRTHLANHGITAEANYTADILGNPVGGKQKGFAYCDSWGLGLEFDLEKMYGWKGFELFTNVGVRGGSNLARKIGNQFPPSQLYGNQSYWLDTFYLQKTYCNKNAHFRIGRMQAGDYFLQSPLYYAFISNAFDGNPIGVFFNGEFSAYPNAQWGVYNDSLLTPQILTKVAVFNTNDRVSKPKYHGCNFSFNNKYGAQVIGQCTYLLNQGPCDHGLPGNYSIGYLYYTGTFKRFSGECQRGNYGYYFMIDQMIYRRCKRTITPFAALLFAPDNRNTFPFFFTSGIVGTGLIPGRREDVTALGVAYGSYSSDLRRAEQNARNRTQNFEMVLEANHLIRITPWFYIQPDIQYIIKPMGYSNIPNALVLGFQTAISF